MPSIWLLGCVKPKHDGACEAKSLYRSPLWQRRRAYAEASSRPWLILSALHGLVEPEQLLEPYDLALTDLPVGERRAWGARVVAALEDRFGQLQGTTFEVHAGAVYRQAIEPERASMRRLRGRRR
jgi:hypothetical protein